MSAAARYPEGRFAHGLMFHHFHGGVHAPGQGAITSEEFDDLIEFADPSRILPALEWQERSRRGTLGPNDLCITFDDALRCQIDIALPVLEARGLTAFWFVYSSVFEGVIERLEVYRYVRTVCFPDVDSFYDAFDAAVARSVHGTSVDRARQDPQARDYLSEYAFYSPRDRWFRFVRDRVLGEAAYFEVMDAIVTDLRIDRANLARLLWMNEADLQRLGRTGHVVGLHSYTHPTRMAGASSERQRGEYTRNREHLERVLGCAPKTMSHPCNSYGPETLEILRDLGVELGFRANLLGGPGSALERPRADHADVLALARK